MGTFLYGSYPLNSPSAPIKGKSVFVKITAGSDASSLVVYVAAGLAIDGSDATELQSEISATPTRVTLSAGQVANLAINGLTRGVVLVLKTAGGSGSASMMVQTAHD